MTGRTHDLTAFAALSLVVATQPLPPISLGTAIVALGACFIGGLAPDIDQPTAALWNRIPAGAVWGRVFSPFLGGHRYISHSLLGIALFGIGLRFLLDWSKNVLVVDGNVVWWAFMIGFVSHLLIDTITREGVPWLFPIPVRFGIPPVKSLRIKTGEFMEKGVVFPLLLVGTGYIYYHYHQHIITFFKQYLH